MTAGDTTEGGGGAAAVAREHREEIRIMRGKKKRENKRTRGWTKVKLQK